MEYLQVRSVRAFAATSDAVVGSCATRMEPLISRCVVLKAHEVAKMMTVHA